MTPFSSFYKLALAMAFIVAGLLVSECQAQHQIGDRVVVTANFKTKIFKKEVDFVMGGSIHTLIAMRDDWCALNDVRGWLPKRYVMDLDMAKRHFDKRIKDNDRDAHAFAHRGMVHREFEDYQNAVADLTESLRIDAKNPSTWYNLGAVRNAQGRFADAVKDMSQSIELYKEYAKNLKPEARDKYAPEGLAIAYYNLGLSYYGMQKNREAINAFDEAIKIKPKNAWYILTRGSAKHGASDNEGAIADYKEAIELNKRLADAYVGLSNVYLGQEKFDEARNWANQAVEVQPKNAMALNSRGWINYKLNDLESAMLDFNRAIRYAPGLTIAYNNRGVCFAAQGEFERAIKDYDRSIQLIANNPLTYSNRATAYMGMEKFAKAAEDFEKAARLAPNVPEISNAMAWFLATCPEEKFRDGELAVKKARSACEMTKFENWTYMDTLAASYADQENFEEAIKHCEKVVELAPESSKEEVRNRLALYKSNKPFRSEVGKTGDPLQK